MKFVDYHTLTIEILAKTAQRQHLGYEEITQALKTNTGSGVNISHSGYKPVEKIKSYLCSIFNLGNLNGKEQDILKHLSFLPSTYIPFTILETLLDIEGLEKGHNFSAILNSLTNYGYIQQNENEDTYKIHLIISEVVRDNLKPDNNELIPLINKVSDLLYIDQAKDNPIDKFSWTPFGNTLLNLAGDINSPEAALLLSNLALVYKVSGDYEKARGLLEKALASDISNFGENHPDVAVTQSNMALVYQYLGDYEKARGLWVLSYTTFLSFLGPNHPNTKTVKRFLDDLDNRK